MILLYKIFRGLKRLTGKLPADPRVWKLLELRRSQCSEKSLFLRSALEGRVLAIEGVEDPIFHGLLTTLAYDLRNKLGLEPWMLQVRSINGAIGTGLLPTLIRSWPLTALSNAQWKRASADVIFGIGYQSGGWQSPLEYWVRRQAGYNLQKCLQQQGGLSTLRIDGILIGDLVIDSYLRFRPAATVDMTDPFLGRILAQALREVRLAHEWFERFNPVLYLSSYSTYIEHGIAVRVALARGVPVRVFGNLVTFGKRLSIDDPYHATNGKDYRDIAESLTDSGAALAKAQELLDERLSGKVDQVISYMRQSAYVESGEEVPNMSGTVVVFLHDFFDSPHIYADLIFDDFWEWISFTIRTLTDAGVPFFVKPHPNQIEASAEVLERLRLKFPEMRLLSTRITNRQLVDAGLGAGVSVYGTVGHELAYLGVPVICCARHPHHAFDFCRTAKSLTEYEAMLRQPFLLALERHEMRRQALQFYYAHNLHGSPEALALRSHICTLFKIGNDDSAPPESLAQGLADLSASPEWSMFIDDLVQDMQSRL